MRLVFPGLGQSELQNNFRGSHSFGALVHDAVVRSLGVAAGRVVVKDVSAFPKSTEADSPKVEVTLTLLPDERLLPTEPSAQELADEINRQLNQSTSYLNRQLRFAFPEQPDADTVKAVRMAQANPERSSASSPLGAGVMCTLLLTLVWL